ncbi:MAG: ATP-dependent chaperone ClpB, partial [Rubripirellula sp.]|nr:ATP-dependent chaperone ClpB [Rubripirellula sp.]
MTFRFDKLTNKAQALVADAQARAASAGNPEINPLHLLAGMLDESDGITRPLLEKMKVDVGQLGKLVASETEKLPSVTGGRQPGIAPNLQKTFDAAAQAAEGLK